MSSIQKIRGVGRVEEVLDLALAFGPIYEDATYRYFGEAAPGTALTEPKWRVSRVDKVTGREEWADGDASFDNVFTDLATVQNFVYK